MRARYEKELRGLHEDKNRSEEEIRQQLREEKVNKQAEQEGGRMWTGRRSDRKLRRKLRREEQEESLTSLKQIKVCQQRSAHSPRVLQEILFVYDYYTLRHYISHPVCVCVSGSDQRPGGSSAEGGGAAGSGSVHGGNQRMVREATQGGRGQSEH